MFVYTDASSAILLELSGLFDQLLENVSVVMSHSVYMEISKPGYPGSLEFKTYYQDGKFRIKSTRPKIYENSNLSQLDIGERETICNYLENNDGYVLTDDGKAARWCFKQGTPFINALLVPKIFLYKGLISKHESILKMEKICKIGRYSTKVETFARECTQEDLACFMGGNGVTKNNRR